MIHRSRPILLAVALTMLGACATQRVPLAVVAPPLRPPAQAAVPMPGGGHPGMAIPAALPDGSYATPNRDLSEAATIWHLRAGLNVAALACRGPDDAMTIPRYNAMLVRQRGVLHAAETRLADEYRVDGGAAWRVRYDRAMTSLYNFFSQYGARDPFCAAAARILRDGETVAPAALATFAAARLPVLDATFTDFYRRYDAWRTQRLWITLGPVATLPEPDGREVLWSPAPLEVAAARIGR